METELVLTSLLGEELVVNDTKSKSKDILKKIKESSATNDKKKTERQLRSKALTVEDRLSLISEEVMRVLGKFKSDTLVIYSRDELHKYIDLSIANGVIAVDTETNNSLDPITCKLMGACIYTPNQKQAYIPINHINKDSGERLSNQLTEIDIKEEFDRLKENNVKTIFHNGKFDYQVIKMTCNCVMNIWWDTMVASNLIDENDQEKSLKWQYVHHVDPSQEKYDIEHLFEGVKYAIVPPEIFALYAATDPYITYKLYEYQANILDTEDMKKVKKLFFDVEMPIVQILSEVELNGISIDKEYASKLQSKYHKELEELDKTVNEELHKYDDMIAKWRLTKEANYRPKKSDGKECKSKNEQLSTPVNLESPTQLAILLYDIIKVPVIDKKNPRGTGKDIIDAIDNPLCKAIRARKQLLKLSKDFVDALPLKVNVDGKVHCSFRQYGAATGRFSCSNPNLQQVPSHATDIRMMFEASSGNVLIGGDFSAQEPRICAFTTRDIGMLSAYQEGKDLYSYIASMSFNKPYEECLEFYPEGTHIIIDGKDVTCKKKEYINEDGKGRRNQAKKILLGLLYGRGVSSIAEQLGVNKDEAQQLVDKFFKAFPSVEKWINDTHKKVHKVGYVEDWYGRRRRLPNVLLPQYEISSSTKGSDVDFNPFIECGDRVDSKTKRLISQYYDELDKAKYNKQISEIVTRAYKDGIVIKQNNALISEAERQSVNAIIQGGAATLTKLAMINISRDKVLNECGFKMLIQVHDEVLGECPIEYADVVAKRLQEVMIETAKPYMDVPMSVDAYVVSHWYEDNHSQNILDEYNKLIKKNQSLTFDEAFDIIKGKHEEVEPSVIYDILKNGRQTCFNA